MLISPIIPWGIILKTGKTSWQRVGRGRSLPLWEALDLDLLGTRDREPERAHKPCIKSKTSDVQDTKGSMLSEV